MRFTVLIIWPPGFSHSQCFAEVAETIHDGLIKLGHESSLTTNVVPGTKHIVLGSNLLPALQVSLPADSILYNLEQLKDNTTWLTPDLIAAFRRYRVWDYAQENAIELLKLGVEVEAILPISYFDGLTRITRSPHPNVDVLFVGTLNERRARVLQDMRAQGLNTVHLSNSYGAERDAQLGKSKLLLNTHYYDAKLLEQVRISYYLANRIPVLSEYSSNIDVDAEWGAGVCFSAYEDLASTALRLCRDDDARRRLAEDGFRFISQKSILPHLENALTENSLAPAHHTELLPIQRRNEICSCGSGKRYKHCHGKR